jgi:iron(III) transport system substrate-binding protein
MPRAIALVTLASLVLAACGSSGSSSGNGTLVVYSAQHPQTTAAIVAAFTKQTGIKVLLKNDSEDVLTAQLQQEGGRSPADVFFTENSNWLQQLDDRNMLANVAPSTLSQVPSRDDATNGNWLGVSGRFSVLIYNPSKISAAQLPTSPLGLADPKYRGKLEIAPSETDFWPIIASIARARGSAAALTWLKGMKANAGSNDHAPDNETVVGDISKGLADIGLINHYYYYRIRSEMGAANFHAKLVWFAPRDPGYVEDISGAGILRSAPHKAAAQKFLAFLVSPAGQRVIAHSVSYEYPLVKSIAPNPQLPPLSSLKPNPVTPAQIGTGLDARNLLREAGLI